MRGKCRICGVTGTMDIHHIISQSEYPELAEIPGNMVLLCRSCHEKTTSYKLKNKKRVKAVKCFKCGRAGHFAADCKAGKKPVKRRGR
jgi:5-methylcytosine-specific restriction endonuclease McrA